MDTRRRNTKRFHPRPQALPDPVKRETEKAGFGGLDPAKLGLGGPAWLIASPAEPGRPAEASSPSQLLPVEPHAALGVPAPTRTLLDGMKVVCICKGIKKSTFWKALDAGAQTKEDINRLTGSGSGGCNGRRCGPRIVEMLRDFSQ